VTLIHIERCSDSPMVESVIRSWMASDGSILRPSESHWHLAVVRMSGTALPIVVGPLTTAGIHERGDDLTGRLQPTLFLKGAAWQFPDF
jgi:hypothetical protein